MLRLALRQLIVRRLSSGLAAAGLLTATLGFILLATTARTTEATLRGDVQRAWAAPYDILVRPAGSGTALEASDGLVRPNYLTETPSGITQAQVGQIRQIPGVQVAAPIAIVGFVDWPAGISVNLQQFVSSSAVSVFRIHSSISADAGLSEFALDDRYVVVAPDGRVVASGSNRGSGATQVMEVGSVSISCPAPAISCFGPTSPACPLTGPCDQVPGLRTGTPGYYQPFDEPIVVAGVDPVSEAQLTGIPNCMTSGRFLGPSDEITRNPTREDQAVVPIVFSNRSYLDESVAISIDRAADPMPILTGASPQGLNGWQKVLTESKSADDAYASMLASIGSAPTYNVSPIWSASAVRYKNSSDGTLQVVPQPTNPAIFGNPLVLGGTGAPPEASDTWFRNVAEHSQLAREEVFNGWQVVGQYRPSCLSGFSQFSSGGLDAYSVDAARLPDGRLLGPSRSMAGYITSPPLALTTLDGARYFADPNRFKGAPGDAFITAVRIKVSGTGSPTTAAEGRLSRIAAQIREGTGLSVDIVRGSSAQNERILLPAGQHGRPPLTLEEGWAAKGVAFRFVQALSAQNLATLALVLLVATLLVAQTAYVSVRTRRTEFGVLRAVGWPTRRIAWLVELEMIVLGLVVGVLAVGMAIPITIATRASIDTWQLVGAAPLALVVAGLAGLGPALEARRSAAVAAIIRPESLRDRHPVRSLRGLALRQLLGPWRVEALVGTAAVAIGSMMVGGVLLLSAAFQGQLDATVLGRYLSARVEPFHVVIAGLSMLVAGLASGEIVMLGYLERTAHFGTLEALGWPRRVLARLLGLEAAFIAVSGGLIGAAVVAVIGFGLGASGRSMAEAAGAALAIAVLAGLVVVVAPVIHAIRMGTADLLRGESGG